MKKSTIMGLLCAMPLVTGAMQSDRVVVSLTMPGSVMLFHEKTPITVTITNQSETQIPFIRDVSHAYNTQIWIDLGNEEPFTHQPPFGLRERKTWPKEITVDKWPEESRLNPGETGMWTLTYSPHMRDIIDYASARGTTSITVRVQLGNNQWASSETLPFRIAPNPANGALMKKDKIAEVEYFHTVRNRNEKSAFYVIPVGGKNFLFDSKDQRLCEIPEDDEPIIHHDADTDMVTVSFAKSRRKIIYDPRRAKVIQ